MPTETTETCAIAAVAAAAEQSAGAIVVLSTSGNTARLISKYRPTCPIITGKSFLIPIFIVQVIYHIIVTRSEQTARQMHLHRACYPFYYPEPRGVEAHQWQTDVSI